MWRSAIIKDVTVLRSWSNLYFETEVRIVNGINKYVTETSEEIPVASVENRGTGKPVAKAKPRPKPTLINIVSSVYSLSWTKMDRVWSRKIQSMLLWSVKIHDQIVATWWWSCKIWRLGRRVQGKVWWYFAMANWSLDNFLGERRTEEKVSVLLEPQFFETFPVFPSNPGTIRSYSRLILHCKTMYCCRMTSQSTSTTSGTLTTCTPSSRADWFQEEEVSKGTGSQCFSQPWTRCTPVKIWKNFNTIWTNPALRCTKILGEFTNIQKIGAIWNSLKEKDCSSIKPDRTQSPFSTHDVRFVLRKWFSWRLERNYTVKYINPQGYRASYSRQICNMDVRILPTSKRENPPTIKANKAWSTGKPVAHTSQASRRKSAR